jgi:hypothetical protein
VLLLLPLPPLLLLPLPPLLLLLLLLPQARSRAPAVDYGAQS